MTETQAILMGVMLVVITVLTYIIRMLMKQIDRMDEVYRKERQMLLDRIQAKDLPEYKALTMPPRPKEPKPPKEELTPV